MISSIIHSLEKKRKGLAAFPGIFGYKAYLPRGVRFLGERYLFSRSSFGTAEAETFACCYLEGTHFCRCFCIYFFASTAGSPQPYGFCLTVLSTYLLFALSKPCQAHQKYSRYDLLASVERERRNLIYGFNTSWVEQSEQLITFY